MAGKTSAPQNAKKGDKKLVKPRVPMKKSTAGAQSKPIEIVDYKGTAGDPA